MIANTVSRLVVPTPKRSPLLTGRKKARKPIITEMKMGR